MREDLDKFCEFFAQSTICFHTDFYVWLFSQTYLILQYVWNKRYFNINNRCNILLKHKKKNKYYNEQ